MNALLSPLKIPFNKSLARRTNIRSASPVRCGEKRFELTRGRVLSFDLSPGESCVVTLTSGLLWATFSGDPADYLVNAGRRLTFTAPGRLVLEALEPATLIVGAC